MDIFEVECDSMMSLAIWESRRIQIKMNSRKIDDTKQIC